MTSCSRMILASRSRLAVKHISTACLQGINACCKLLRRESAILRYARQADCSHIFTTLLVRPYLPSISLLTSFLHKNKLLIDTQIDGYEGRWLATRAVGDDPITGTPTQRSGANTAYLVAGITLNKNCLSAVHKRNLPWSQHNASQLASAFPVLDKLI